MARFSTAQREVLKKLQEQGSASASQVQSILRNAEELKKVGNPHYASEGGSVGFARGGMPQAPGAAPTPVQDPGEWTGGSYNDQPKEQRAQWRRDHNAHMAKKRSFQAYQKKLRTYNTKAKAYQDANLKSQQKLVQKSLKDPKSLVVKQKVDTIA